LLSNRGHTGEKKKGKAEGKKTVLLGELWGDGSI
jgi:hypothetical protein